MEKGLVSIVIPCYNHEKFIDSCLDSMIDQSYHNIELLICDDCSQDRTSCRIEGRLEAMKRRFKRVVFHKNNKNKGVSGTLNGMLKTAQGEYIKTLASDDFLHRNYIEEAVSYLGNHPCIDVVVTNGRFVSENTTYPLQNEEHCKKLYYTAPDMEHHLFESLYCNNFIYAAGTMLRQQVIEQHGLFDEKTMLEDWEYWLRITCGNKVRIGYIDSILAYYRISNNSVTSMSNNTNLAQRRARIHKAEMDVIDKYGDYVAERVYAERKAGLMASELRWGLRLGLRSQCSAVKEEMKTFDKWGMTPFKKRVKSGILYLICCLYLMLGKKNVIDTPG